MKNKPGYTSNYYQNQKQVIKAAGIGRIDRAITNPKKQFESKSDAKKGKQDIVKTMPNVDLKEIAAMKIFRLLLTNYRRNQYKKQLKWHRYRQFVVEELIKTEQNYINDLQLLIVIKNTLAQWLNKIQLDAIFMNVNQLHKLNDSFFKELQAISPYKRPKILGKTLFENAPFFKIYFTYYEGFNKSTIMVKQCRNDKQEVKKFLTEIQHLSDFNYQDIDSLLIKPVQRLPKYLLLIEDLLKHTEKTHPDYENLKKSLELFHKVADDNNANMNRLLSSKLFDLQKWFGNQIEVIDSRRQYLTELLAQIFYQNKEKNVTAFFLNDLIIVGERQDILSKPYSYVQSVFLDELSECLDISDQQYIKNSFILQGMNGQSITFLEQSPEEKTNKIDTIKKLIEECKEKSKFKFERKQNRLQSSEVCSSFAKKNYPIRVTALGVDERQENLSSYKIYIIEVGIGDIFQKIFLRYSQCIKIQDEIKRKYPKLQLNFLKQSSGLGLFNDQKKEIEVRMLQIPLFIQSLLLSDIPILDSTILVDLGLPENFYNLPNLITDEIRGQAEIQQKGIDRLSYISPQRTLTKGFTNSDQSSLQQTSQIRRFSASQLLKKDSLNLNQKSKKSEKDMITIMIHHFMPTEKPLNIVIQSTTKVLYVLEQLQNEFQLQEIYDFKLLIYDSKQRLKILQNDEQVIDLFANSFLFDALKKKELYFRKIIFLDIESEKVLLYQDTSRLKLLYYQFVKDISTAQLTFTHNDGYSKIAALYYYLQNKPLTYEILQQIIPNTILKTKSKDYWLCVISAEYKMIKDSIDNTQSTMIESTEPIITNQIKTKGGIFSSLVQPKSNDEQKQWENTNIDSNKGMMQVIIQCLNNEFCVQQLFKVSCKEAQSQFGEQNLILGVSIYGIKLYNSTKDRVWKTIETIESFNIYPGSIEITYGAKKYILETSQGFQIQSLFDEYQALKSSNQQNL